MRPSGPVPYRAPFTRGPVSFPDTYMMKGLLAALAAVPLAVGVVAQQFPTDMIGSTPVPAGEGWSGFSDSVFLLDAFIKLSLAVLLGAVMGYHPRRLRTADTLEEIEAPKVSIVYAVLGSLIGILVVEYGWVMGFVLFGIGGLIRFRTVMRSAQLTGQVIFVTLIGITAGLDLPHVAVLATVFDFVLTFFLESRITYSVDIRGLPSDRFVAASEAYRSALEDRSLRVLSEKKSPNKGRVEFIFRSSRNDTRAHVEKLVEQAVAPELRGSLNWEID